MNQLRATDIGELRMLHWTDHSILERAMADRGLLQSLVSQLLKEGATMDAILVRLRENGASKLDSIRALCHGSGISLKDAKQTVHFSPVWADAKERDEHFWEELEAALPDDSS